MTQKILVAGATGNLGERIAKSLVAKGAEVRAIVRSSSPAEKVSHLQQLGIEVIQADLANPAELTQACQGVTCVVSSLQGLRDVIVDSQKNLLDAAIAAGVPRFIPSDFSLDFTLLPGGQNRNFDLRREFHQAIAGAPIAVTSVFNGAFAEVLAYNMPVLDAINKTVGYWGEDPDWQMDFTTMDDTAAFTAAAALDPDAPPKLNIASFQISPQALQALASDITGTEFKLVPMGSLEQFAAYNQKARAEYPAGENEVFPRWQSAQYMHDMFCAHHAALDNGRYPDLSWTSSQHFLQALLNRA